MISVVVPTYYEAANISPLVKRIHSTLTTAALEYELIIVDDESADGTEEVVSRLRSDSYPVRLITRRGERGLSSAVLLGFQQARGDILVCMDADLSHPPERIPALVQCLTNHEYEFALGSRYISGGSTDVEWGVLRWLNSKLATVLARPFTHVKDPMSGFFAVRRSLFERAENLNPIGYKIGLELIVKCRCEDVKEVPIHFAKRRSGESKTNLREQLNYLRHLKRLADFRFGAVWRLFPTRRSTSKDRG